MNNLTPSIADDIETLVAFVNNTITFEPQSEEWIKTKRANERVESFLATFTPNHLEEKEFDH